jgi:uncharacterized protein (TIRG00374 family)
LSIDLKAILKYLVLFVFGIGVLIIAFKGQDLTKIWSEIKSAHLFWLLISSLCVFIAHLLRALRWQMLFHSLNYKVSIVNSFCAVIIGYFANLLLPRFGEIAKCTVIQKTNRVPIFASIGTVVAERIFDLVVLLLSGLGMLLFQYTVVAEFLSNYIFKPLYKHILTINYLLVLAILIFSIIILLILFKYLKERFRNKYIRVLASLKQGLNSYFQLDKKPLFLIYTFGIWFFYLLSIYIAFWALNSTARLGMNVAYTAIVFSGFAMIAPVQGGIGVFHWMVARALMLYSVPFNDGLAYATLIHSSQFLLIILFGILSLWFLSYKKNDLG